MKAFRTLNEEPMVKTVALEKETHQQAEAEKAKTNLVMELAALRE